MTKKKAKKDKTEKEALLKKFARIIGTEVPPALSSQVKPLLAIGSVFLAVSIIMFFMEGYRGFTPFGLLLATMLIILSYLRKREYVLRGYREELFKIIDYTYLMPTNRLTENMARPSGLLVINSKSEVYQIPVINRAQIPALGWIISVYVPSNVTVAEYNGKLHFSNVYAYAIKAEDEVDEDSPSLQDVQDA